MMPPEMADALMLMVPSEQERFVDDCLGYTTCSREELKGYVWQSDNIREMGEDRFWFTYLCTRSGDVKECPVDGNWSPWSVWGDCSVTCGQGSKVRSRTCSHPLPSNGGRDCDGQANKVTGCRKVRACANNGSDTEMTALARASEFLHPYHEEDPELERACLWSHCSYQQVQDMVTPPRLADEYWTHLNCYKHLEGCPVDGGWSIWGPWSGCSSNCGEGKAYRVRQCDNPRPRTWGRECEGSTLEEGPCFDNTCVNTVGVFLTPWSPWSECTPTLPHSQCGEGVRASRRRCHGNSKCNIGGGEKATEITREIPCEAGICPQSGSYSDWGEWTTCTAMCSEGYRVRQRVCDSPPPHGIGMNCDGEPFEMGECYHDAIFCRGVESLNTPMYTEWDPWSECSTTCNGGVQVRYRSCVIPGQLCFGQLYDYTICNVDVPCPINGGWTEWTKWAVCSETCGQGTSSQYRQCINPRPEYGGEMCEGESHKEKTCNNGNCPGNSAQWGEWEEWGRCSSTCKGGTMIRERGCSGGGSCNGEIRQLGICNYHKCPVDGNWASWGEWGQCSVSCGEGMTFRDRTCTDPAPEGNGEMCGGFGTDVRHCYDSPCAAEGSVIRTFDGTSFMVYRRSGVPTKHLFLYIRFLSETLNGMLVLRRVDEHNAPLVYIGLDNGYVKLFVRNGVAEIDLLGDQIKSPGWNSAEIAVSGRTARIRVNNGMPVFGNFSALSTVRVDWDLKMYVGGTLPNLFPRMDEIYLGFVGKIGALRVNYHEYSLQQQEEWIGAGLPLVSLNVGDEPGDIDAELPDFSGREYVIFPCNLANESRTMDLSLAFKAEMPDGVLVYIPGVIPGSFVAVSLSKSRVVLTLNMGSETVDAKSEPIALSEWILLNVASQNFEGEIRVNRGPAIQLNAQGPRDTSEYKSLTHFHPIGIIFVGGVNLPYESILLLSIGDAEGFVGRIYKISVGSDEYMLRDATLTTSEKYVDSTSVSLAANYREVHASLRSGAWLRCNYSWAPQNEDIVIKWLKWDRILDLNDKIDREDNDPRYPKVSSIRLKEMNIDASGMYACQMRYGGAAVVTNAFGISIYKPPFAMMDNDQVFALLVLMSVAMAFCFICAIVILSFCAPLRRRFYLFDYVYESVIACCECERCAAGTAGIFTTYHEMQAVDATYEGFSARKEKAKLDAQIEQRKRDKLKAKLRSGKNKTKDALTKKRVQISDKLHRKKQKSSRSKGKRSSPSKSKRSSPSKGRTSERKGKGSSPSKGRTSAGKSKKSSVSPKTRSESTKKQKTKESSPPPPELSDSNGNDIPSDAVQSEPDESNTSNNNQEVTHQNNDITQEEAAGADNVSDVDDEPTYMNIESLNAPHMNRRESMIQEGLKDMGGHMFNSAAGGAAAALSAAIVDLDVTGNSATASVESLAYDLDDIVEGLDAPIEEEGRQLNLLTGTMNRERDDEHYDIWPISKSVE
ncbi:uncharacterized protein [Amphiura filiformis]|uniref:uncharacterized protein n=1 Tax=Amphiura filiformis TaxID=82378 RepID=UPI003B20FB19